jgi:peroxiredoxin
MAKGELGARDEESSQIASAETRPADAASANAVEPPANDGTCLPEVRDRGRPTIQLTSLQVLAMVALAVFTIFITWRAKALEKAVGRRTTASTMISKKAPDFSLSSLNGETVTLTDYRDKKIVVVSYWASWCGPCRIELQQLRDFYNRYHKNDANFEILAISIDEDKDDAEKYVASEKLSFPVLLDSHAKTADAYDVEAIPTMFVIDKAGKVTYANTGLDESMQFQLMNQLGIKFPGMENGGDVK